MLGGWKVPIPDVRIPADSQFPTLPAAKRRRPHATFTGMNSAGFFFGMSTTYAHLAVVRRAGVAQKTSEPQAASASTSRRISLILRIARATPASVLPSSYFRSSRRPTKLPDSTRIHGFALRRAAIPRRFSRCTSANFRGPSL